MKNNLTSIKKFFVLFVIIMLSTFFIQEGAFSLYKIICSAQTTGEIEIDKEYENKVDQMAKSVGFSEDYESFYEQGQPVTLYNFVSLIRFQNEAESINTVQPALNMTYVEILEEMYNAEDNYSVNKYYKNVSNNMLNLVTIFVTQSSSLQISKPRSTYGEQSVNNGVGYDENEKIMNVLPVQYALEYEMLDQIYYNAITTTINTANYRELSDYNNDGLIDSLSIMLLPDPNKGTASEVNVGWSDLLWPHSSQVQVSLIQSYGWAASLYGYSISASHFNYTYNSKTYSAGNYMLSDVNFSSITSVSNLPINTTFVHELGHVLGWPDYYVYSGADYGETAPTDTVPVGLWEIMASSSFALPQYPTSYSRNLQGWLGENGVTEITQEGQYTLKQVNYEEAFGVSYNGRTVAYKITNPNNPYQSIWFEYRKQVNNTFEQNSSYVPNGLLVYRVDEGFGGFEISGFGTDMLKSAGNFAAAPYNLYIFRNDIATYSDSQDLQRAPLNTNNKSMGDNATYIIGGKTYSATDITWQIYDGDINTPQNQIAHSDVTYEDSGMTVEIISVNEATGEITFEVNYAPLNNEIVNASDFGDYALYTKLLELAGKQSGDNLFATDLKNVTNLVLKDLSLTSVLGLELMQFDNLQTINLNNNNLNNISELNSIIANNPNAVISLIKNKFNLSALNSTNLQSSNFIWGMQLNLYDENHYIFNNLTHQVIYYWQSFYDTYFTMSLNGQSLPKSVSLQYYTFTTYGEYEFNFEANTISGFSNDEQNLFVTIIGVTLPGSSVQRNDEFPNVSISGISIDKLNILSTEVDTSIIAQNIFVTWTISVKEKPTATYSINGYFNVIDDESPVITLESESPLQVVYGESLILPTPEILITDNGENVSYEYIENPESTDVSYWSKDYYFYEDGDYTLLDGDLLSQDIGEYAIGYYAVDDYGNSSSILFRHVMITGRIIEQNNFSLKLYNALLNITGETKIYENSLYEYSYIDLTNLELTSFSGLELLMYQTGAIIDLSNNKIDNIMKMTSLLENPNIQFVNLTFNNLVNEVLETNPRYILGIQGLTKDIYLYHMIDPILGVVNRIRFYNYNDHQSYYSYFGSVNIQQGNNYIENFGTYTFTYNSLNELDSITKTIKFGNVYEVSSSVTFEVFSNVTIYDLYQVEGINRNDVEFEYLNGVVEFLAEDVTFGSNIGSFNLTIKVSHNNEILKSIPITLNINDTSAPTISLLGNEFVYLIVGEDYIENGYSAQDNYDSAPITRITGEVNSDICGIYYLTYESRDQSFNYSLTKTRTIYVGNVTPKNNVKVDVTTRIDEIEMFNFETYSKDDFDLTIVGESYNEQIVGTYTINILLTHKQDENFVCELSNLVRVVDRISPTIQLTGEPVVYIYVGSQYFDSGARVNDNYDYSRTIDYSSSSLNVDLVGSYQVTFQAQDAEGNVATPVSRTVNVIYKPFNSLKVFLISSVDNLYLNNMIRFKANLDNYDSNVYNYNSTFIWFVDGVQVQNAKDMNFQTTFDTVGTHQVEVKVLNMNTSGTYTVVDGEIFQVQITEGGFLERYGLTIIIITSVIIVLAVIYSLFMRHKRKFYF